MIPAAVFVILSIAALLVAIAVVVASLALVIAAYARMSMAAAQGLGDIRVEPWTNLSRPLRGRDRERDTLTPETTSTVPPTSPLSETWMQTMLERARQEERDRNAEQTDARLSGSPAGDLDDFGEDADLAHAPVELAPNSPLRRRQEPPEEV